MYWLIVMVFAAVVAAIMSTADSALLSIGSMFTKDIYKSYFRREASAREMLIVGKTFAWGIMAILILMAWVSLETESSIWVLIELKLEFMVQLSPVFMLGVYWRRMPASAVLSGMVLGTLLTPGHLVRRRLRRLGDPQPLGRGRRRVGPARELRRLRRLDRASPGPAAGDRPG